ncbi:MAG: nucleotidyltransferase family protein [Bacteroidaceae bacterium]|nr:nucleotidyltransferase family protein [Bacteroidaceae bacterium]
MLFFELLQIAIGNRSQLSHTPTAEEWRELYALAQKQAMVGIAFRGVEKLPVEQRPQRVMLMQWYMATERIKALNEEMDRKTLAVANKFLEEGFPGVVLKGQGIAKLYQLSNYEDGPHPSKLSTKDSLVPINRQSEQPTLSHRVGSRERGDSGHPGCSQISHTELTEDTEFSCNAENICQRELDTNSQNARIASLACGHPDGTVDRRPLTVDTCLDSKQVERSSISNYRTPGDIDIWLHGERSAILKYVRRCVPDCKPVYHHVDFPVVSDVSIEVHFTPTWMNSPLKNHRLQRFFSSTVYNQQTTDNSQQFLPDGDTKHSTLNTKQATLPTPNNAFNRIYILVHIYRHLFAEGIGLKQLLDYYFVLQQGFTEVEREETLRTLRSLGMMRFTRAVMWVLQEVYGLPDRYLLTSPDAKEGRFLLDEIMLAGNFGKYDERMQRAEGEGTFRWGLRKVIRNFRFVRSYPSEVLWSPLFKVWHLFWRMGHA